MLQDGVLDSARAEAGGEDAPEGYATLVAPVADELAGPDLLFANLETPVAPRQGKVWAGPFSFNAPPAAVRALRDAGLDLVSVANNHIFDRRRRGLLQTLAHLDVLGVWHVGAGPAPWEAGPRVLEVEGVRVAFLAWTQHLNLDFNACREPRCPRVAVLRQWEPAEEAVRAAAAQADVVVVSLHWGEEYARQPGPGEEGLARRLADAGAHVVLGHHPHVLQPLELYRRGDGGVSLLAYSLGNFVSNQARDYRPATSHPAGGDTRDGALLRVELVRWRDAQGRPRVALSGVDALPLWTEHAPREGGGPPRIRVVALARALDEVRAARAREAEQGGESAAEGLGARERLYEERLARITARLGEGFIRPPGPLPPPPAAPVASLKD
jgi:poly-gamma-glutamate synthesis protein (capsule biosynthesis protein)